MAYYFEHDDNARRDPKVLRLRRIKGMKGVGIYWCIIEIMHEQNGFIKNEEIGSIAFELQEDESNVISVIKEFDLFVIQQYGFGNTRVSESLERRSKNSKRGRDNVAKRWEKQQVEDQVDNTVVLPKSYSGNTIIQDNTKENNINLGFSAFWDLYGKKVGDKEKCDRKWKKLTEAEREKIMQTLPAFLKTIKDKQFQPYPEAYLNKKRWNDDIDSLAVKPGKPHGNARIYN